MSTQGNAIKAVLWDFGGGFTPSPFAAFARYEDEHGLPKDFIRSINATNPDANAWAKMERNEVSHAEFGDLFGRAAELGVSIEITTGAFPSLGGGEREGMHDESFLRIYGLALEAGCLFHFASDTHSLEGVGRVCGLEPFVHQLGLTRENLHPLVRGV